MSIDDSRPTDLASAHALIMARSAGCSTGASNGGGERGAIPRAVDREAQVHDQEATARAVRPILGAWRAARAARASTRRLGRGCVASRNGGADGDCGRDEREDCGAVLRTAPASAPAAAPASAARAHRLSGALGLPVLWGRDIAQDR